VNAYGIKAIWFIPFVDKLVIFICRHRYNKQDIEQKNAIKRTVSTGQKGSKSTYNCPKNVYNTTLKHNIKKGHMN